MAKEIKGLGTCIRAARRRHDPPVTQAELARMMKYDVTSLSRLESGRVANPSLAIVLAIARSLRISVDKLIGWQVPVRKRQIPQTKIRKRRRQ